MKVAKPLHSSPILSVLVLVAQGQQPCEMHCVTPAFQRGDRGAGDWQARLLLPQPEGEDWLVLCVTSAMTTQETGQLCD